MRQNRQEEANPSSTNTDSSFHLGKFIQKTLLLLIPILLFLSLICYKKGDLAILEGGRYGIVENDIGYLGAVISRFFFYTFGFASYYIIVISLIVFVRLLIPVPRKIIHGYFIGLLCIMLGIVMLMAMWPENYIMESDSYGIGRQERYELSLPGGAVGAFLTAPQEGENMRYAGIIRKYIGDAGSLIVISVLMIPSLVVVYLCDWHLMTKQMFRKLIEYLKKFIDNYSRAHNMAKQKRKENDDSDEESEEMPESSEENPVSIVRPCISDKDTSETNGNGIGEENFGNMPDNTTLNHDKCDNDSPEQNTEDERTVNNFGSKTFSKIKSLFSSDKIRQNDEEIPKNEEKNNESDENTLEEDDADEEYMRTRTQRMKAASNGYPESNSEENDERTILKNPDIDNFVKIKKRETTTENVHAPEQQVYSERKSYYDTVPPISSDTDDTDDNDNEINAHRSNTTPYHLPSTDLLDAHDEMQTEDTAHIEESKKRLQETLTDFEVDGQVSKIVVGPRVTRFEISLARGVKVEKITGIASNISMDMEAKSIRILAPIPGMNTVGIEIPNKISSVVYIRSLLESAAWKENRKSIPIMLGRDIAGQVMITDLGKAPHLLIAGTTGSGKSVCMNTLIMSLLFHFSPEDLRLILVDPKVVELEMYRPIPHLITPVVNDQKKVPLALRWGVNEMERRYRVMAKVKKKDLAGFNTRPKDAVPVLDDDGEIIPQKMPLLLIIIDELADIMMSEAKKDVENSIVRIAQKGRAAGVHLVIATQTPRKDVITGLIKANLPTKIAFRVGSNIDSRVILDVGGAEKLLGQGDMLFRPPGADGMERIQGSMVSDNEIQRVVNFVSEQMEQSFDSKVIADDVEVQQNGNENASDSEDNLFDGDDDEYSNDDEMENIIRKYLYPDDPKYMHDALEIILRERKVSTSYLQRRLVIGYNTQANLMDKLEERGIISQPLAGGQKREILITDGLEMNKNFNDEVS